MKKTILTLVLLLIPFTFALSEGQVFSQTALNNYDVDSLSTSQLIDTLQCELLNNGDKIFFKHNWYYYKYFRCLDFEPIENKQGYTGNYQVKWSYFTPYFKISNYQNCVATSNVTGCVDKYKQYLNFQGKTSIHAIRDKVNLFKDIEDNTVDASLAGNIW